MATERKMVASGFRWPGAKNKLAGTILSFSPIKRGRKFIDVCAGRGALTFGAWALGFQFAEWIINDLNNADFFLALRDIGDTIRAGPRSRQEFEKQKRLAESDDPRALLLAPWLCFNGGNYTSGGITSTGGHRSAESFERNMKASCLAMRERNPQISGDDWLVCLEREQLGPNDLVVIDGPYMECCVPPYKCWDVLPIELIAYLKSATHPWVLCEQYQPLFVTALGEPVFQKEVQNRGTNFKCTGGQERRCECVWTSESAANAAKRDTVTVAALPVLALSVPSDRKDPFYQTLSLEQLLQEIRDGIEIVNKSRIQMNVEMRRRLLPALLELKKRTLRKKPGYYETLASMGLNGDTVRQWFYRSNTADEVIDVVEQPEPKTSAGEEKGSGDELEDEGQGGNPGEDESDLRDRFLRQADRIVAALLGGKIEIATRLGREYASARKVMLRPVTLPNSKTGNSRGKKPTSVASRAITPVGQKAV